MGVSILWLPSVQAAAMDGAAAERTGEGSSAPYHEQPDISEEEILSDFDPAMIESLPDMVCAVSKILEGLLALKEFCSRFVSFKGIDLLLSLYTLPRLTPAPSASLSFTPSTALLAAVKVVGAANPADPIAVAFLGSMGRMLATTQAFFNRLGEPPALPSQERVEASP